VEAGLRFGLKAHGVHVVPFRLDQRIDFAHKWLSVMWRRKRKDDPALPKPQQQDVIYHAGVGALEMALRHNVDVVLIVSAMYLHPDVIVLMKRAGLRITVLFTESPYDEEQELRVAALVDGCWTNERSSVPKFRAVNPRAGYLAHAWHPERHLVAARDPNIATHDVVFIGSGFHERVAWFNSIDWTGIDLGLYGNWDAVGLSRHVKAAVRGGVVNNEQSAHLYRAAKIGLNLYRQSRGWGRGTPVILHAESLNPRAYELAACGVFHLSECRAEVGEVFGDLVPTFTTPSEAAVLIRMWLARECERLRVAAQLPACVAEASWTQRAATVIGDLQSLLAARRGAA